MTGRKIMLYDRIGPKDDNWISRTYDNSQLVNLKSSFHRRTSNILLDKTAYLADNIRWEENHSEVVDNE